MAERNGEALNERERACLAHVEEAARLGVSFSRYCREKDLSIHQWTWIKRALLRKGVIGRRRRPMRPEAAGFVPVRIAPTAPPLAAASIETRRTRPATAMAAVSPVMTSTSGRARLGMKPCTNALYVSLMRRWDSAAMVPNTRELLPEPETPVNTVSRRFGISRLKSLRLFWRAPWTRMKSWAAAATRSSLRDSDQVA